MILWALLTSETVGLIYWLGDLQQRWPKSSEMNLRTTLFSKVVVAGKGGCENGFYKEEEINFGHV